jgi:uncharacterized protein YycO
MKILFCRGHGFLAALVRWQTWGKYSHVAVQIGDWIYEAVPPRVRKVEASKYNWKGVDIFTTYLQGKSNQSFEQLLEEALTKELGKRYDYCGVLRFLPRQSAQNPNRWFCSELVFSVFKQLGIEFLSRVDAVKVNPTLLSYSPNVTPV